jgi:putative toxin-antitoxin system antitoxin component (TIGR02293 family)
MKIPAAAVAEILGGVRTLGREVHTPEELRRAVESGLPIEALEHAVRHVAGEGPDVTALKHHMVPREPLPRRGQWLSREASEHLERLARMAALAEVVWEDPALAREFLLSPQPQLGGARPVELAPTDGGARQVEALLIKLEHSLPI